MDLFTRKVIGWSMQERMESKFVMNDFCMALGQRKKADNV